MTWSRTMIAPDQGYYYVSKATPLGPLILSWNTKFVFHINFGGNWGGKLGDFDTLREAQEEADKVWKRALLKTLSEEEPPLIWSETRKHPSTGYFRVCQTPTCDLHLTWDESFSFKLNGGYGWSKELGDFDTVEEAIEVANATWAAYCSDSVVKLMAIKRHIDAIMGEES